ncbi:MAG: DUF5647 family protein [Candidatus Deferrimicrobiaceae bacterium]
MAVNAYEKKQAILVTEFDRSVMEHPEFALQITPGAQIVILVEGDELFDDWARRLAGAQREEGQPVVYFQVKGLKPLHSRFEGPVIQKIA